ncbi:MAG TPA: hypothetical protein VM260_25970 [Pirellula sp.]|nr:hypothetical protein [Pirellula sp.]
MSPELIAKEESVFPITIQPETSLVFSLIHERPSHPWALDNVRELDEIEFQPRWWPGKDFTKEMTN